MTWVVVYLLGLGFAVASYWWLEGIGPRGWVAIACRGAAWGSLGVLVLNPSCAGRPHPGPPLVLLDASLSLAGSPAWDRLRDSAASLGEVRFVGDHRSGQDTTQVRGQSLLGPALRAAAATARPIIVITDGELEDAAELPADLLARAAVAVFPREPKPDAFVHRIRGTARVTLGDSLEIAGEMEANPSIAEGTATVRLRAGERELTRQRLTLTPGGRVPFRLAASTERLRPGQLLLQVDLVAAGDEEPRNNVRLHRIELIPTPGVVVAAEPGDWDAKFLFSTLVDVAELPVRGYVNLAGKSWHTMHNLAPVSEPEVRRAIRSADLVVAKGRASRFLESIRARGVWRWPSGEGDETQQGGDWYISAGALSPISPALLGLPLDSFPPATHMTPVEAAADEWVGLVAQAGRRGTPRPIVIGAERRGRREVLVAADGLWRWAFRGGSSEQGYRAWVAATLTWLLGRPDPAMGKAAPVRPVVPRARPVVFRWMAAEPIAPLPIEWEGPAGRVIDTLLFDGNGEAVTWLPSGHYRYRFPSGGGGLVGVEEFSDEWGVRRVTIASQDAIPVTGGRERSSRDVLWPFGLCVLALAGEWITRRRGGLR